MRSPDRGGRGADNARRRARAPTTNMANPGSTPQLEMVQDGILMCQIAIQMIESP